jgi:hypothetical protein
MEMHDRLQARQAVNEYLVDHSASCGIELAILDHATEEYEFGWVFHYDARKSVETGDVAFAIAGNAPLIYERETGRILVTGTAEPIESYLRRYRLTGDPHKELGTGVRLTGWSCGAQERPATRAIRDTSQMGLAEARRCVEDCVNGRKVVVEANSLDDAARLVHTLVQLGFRADQVPE